MISQIKGINIEDKLNLYLVANALKPACVVTLDPLYFDRDYNLEKNGDTIFIYEESNIKLKPEHLDQFKKYLNKLNVIYHQDKIENWQTYNVNGKPINVERILFQVGKDSYSLERLVNARSDEEIGLSLGYPSDAVKVYGKVINGERRDGQYVQVSLAKARQAGLELPTWLAYISHVPKYLDLVGGKVSETSKALGEKYQKFVRVSNPDLAKRVEEHFLNRRLPDSWERTPNGSYVIYFRHF